MNLILGVSGSVAAYRACDLARELMRQGYTVRVCLTDSAQKFVTPALFEALTGQPCLQDAFDEPERGRMAHIEWARSASAVVVAPATANVLAKLAHGIADDMLTTLAVAGTAPLVVVPAMNPTMYASETNQAALNLLANRGVEIVEPATGDVACGESGQGKFPPIDKIVEAVQLTLDRSSELQGKKVLITSGPTQEPIDIARFVSNRSSGKMGVALAKAALAMGAEVTVVAGPQSAKLPLGANVVLVRTASEMLEAAWPLAGSADWIIGAAAVADYRPTQASPGKVRRSDDPISLEMIPNPDVIAALSSHAPNAKTVGFAAEAGIDPEAIRSKLARKKLFAIAVNEVSGTETGFESDTNRLELLFADGQVRSSDLMSKAAVARWLWRELLGKGYP
ncbi:MAG: bifunctional phosphopantothenoylcysteine decarboxylase/phosphopantothenate--cysteine ligase CoaBC [Armatimonadetes bacterium]|nr:bifunctional phosphopantothenoylcysteine decarboxylase/phosphopantothenate--cysteine ligase CoaBC [Armatimonadota bacterium]